MRYCGKTFAARSIPQMTMWRVRIACWIPNATNSPSGYVIRIDFPLQQWLHERTERTSLLRSTYIASLLRVRGNIKYIRVPQEFSAPLYPKP